MFLCRPSHGKLILSHLSRLAPRSSSFLWQGSGPYRFGHCFRKICPEAYTYGEGLTQLGVPSNAAQESSSPRCRKTPFSLFWRHSSQARIKHPAKAHCPWPKLKSSSIEHPRGIAVNCERGLSFFLLLFLCFFLFSLFHIDMLAPYSQKSFWNSTFAIRSTSVIFSGLWVFPGLWACMLGQ